MADAGASQRAAEYLSAARRFVRGVFGADAYDKYVAHHERLAASGQCHEPLMTEKEFWRDKTDRQEREPQGRCC